jgi:hypothetical protein
LYDNLVHSQSKNEQIDKLKLDLDSSKNQQLKLIDQIKELNKIIFSNQEDCKKYVTKFELANEKLESKIIVLQTELDSLKKIENSKSNDLSLIGKYEYDEKFEGFEDGKGRFVGVGSITISNFKKSESFYFEIEVARVFGEDYAFNGEITGEALIIGDNIARFYNEDCLIVFIFQENKVQIIEESCEDFHGARVYFDRIYTKN